MADNLDHVDDILDEMDYLGEEILDEVDYLGEEILDEMDFFLRNGIPK